MSKLLVPVALLAFAAHTNAAPVVLLSDDFEDGDRTNGVVWYLVKAESSAPVTDDVVFGSKAMAFNNEHSGGSNDNAPFTQKGLVASFPQIQLLVGESIELSFDFRMQAVVNQAGALRFGLGRNSVDPAVPTPVTADGTSNSTSLADDDPMYLFTLSSGTSTGALLREDNATGTGFLTGTDFAGDKDSKTYTLNDTNKRTLVMTIVRNSDTELGLTVKADGNTILSGIDNFQIKSIFNQVGLVSTRKDVDFVVDNVTVTYNAIPEPASAVSLLILSAMGVNRPRRHQ